MGSSLLLRDLADDVKTELRVRAACNGRSMEGEARLILAAALAPPTKMAADGLPWSLGETVRMFFGPENGVQFELPPREPARDSPDFSWVLDRPDEPEAEEDPALKSGR
jgi:plasmid stability protein